MNYSLYLSDILRRFNLDLKRVKLIRHSLNDKNFRTCYNAGYIQEYMQVQKKRFAQGYDYIISFISGPGTSAKLEGFYKVVKNEQGEADEKHVSKDMMPPDFPWPAMYEEDSSCFKFERTDMLSDLVDRLIIDWGKSALSWHQKATNEKPVLAIQSNPRFVFSGYENVVLKYSELRDIVNNFTLYENWHTALSSIYAIYLIVDTVTGKPYVGSAYGSGGLLERWKCYVDSKHGHNKDIIDLMCQDPDRYHHFQFSILQILPKNITADEVISIEGLYKKKLLSIKFGMNEN